MNILTKLQGELKGGVFGFGEYPEFKAENKLRFKRVTDFIISPLYETAGRFHLPHGGFYLTSIRTTYGEKARKISREVSLFILAFT